MQRLMDRVDDLERENNSLGEALKQQESMLCELRDVIYGVRGWVRTPATWSTPCIGCR